MHGSFFINQSPILVMRLVNLTRFDRDLQMILLWREGAGSVIGKSAGRTVSFIEIYIYKAVFFVCIGVVIATGWIRGIPIGRIHELDKQAAVG